MKNSMYFALSDEQLISELLKGDNNCSGVLYSRYYPRVYAKCYSFSRNTDDAFDMTQEILLKAISKIASFSGSSKFSTWIYAIATNYCISYSSRKSRSYYEDIKAANLMEEDKLDKEDFEKRLKWEALELNVDEYLQQLSEEERKILRLKYLMNYSVKDLQAEFAMSASAIKMRLHRARIKMSELISIDVAA